MVNVTVLCRFAEVRSQLKQSPAGVAERGEQVTPAARIRVNF